MARWIGGWPARRVGLAAVAGGLLVLAAVLGYAGPLLAQEGVDIRFGDLSSEPTDTTVDRFFVELSNLTAATTYEVVVASDHATALGIGSCGAASQTRTVTGVEAQELTFVVYACTLGAGTLTATVREAGAATAAATVSQALTVLAIPEGAPAGIRGAPAAAAATRGATRAGTPGVVPNVRFDNITTHSARARWAKPSNGGRALTGFGLLFWRKGTPQPPYSTAFVVGAASRSHTYTGLRAGATYRFRIHACNGADSCGWWTHPPREVRIPTPTPTPTPTTKPTAAPTVGPPGQVQSLRTSNRTATSFTVHWSPHRATGGRPLTGFGLLRREPPNAWPSHDQATVVGAASRSHSFTGLTYGRGQGVRIRACNGTNSCGAWSAEVTVTPLPGPLPTLALPKTTIAIGERMKIGANDVPVGATAYIRLEGPIQPEGRCGASGAARAPAAPRAPSPSTGPGYYDSIWIDGCAPGGDDAVVRLESQDGSVLYDRRTLTVATAAPGQVGRPVVRPRDAALHVDWEAPTDGGSAITHYDVGHRAGAAGAWTETEVRSGTSTTITELTNGTSYEVRVRAVNAKGDGDWSETATGTPSAAPGEAPETSPPGTTPSPPPSCESLPISPPPVPSSLDAPANLDLTPLLTTRRAQLAWAPVSGAAKYKVEIRRLEQGTWGTWGPPNLSGNVANSGEVTGHTCYTIDLDHIVQILQDRMLPDSTKGLGTNAAFGFQVKAINGDKESDFSNELIVIDFSRAYANGDSRDYPVEGQGQAEVNWQRADQMLGSNYSTGQYSFRYRELRHKAAPGPSGFFHHSEPNWQPDAYVPLGTTTDNPITGLTEGSIYGIQIRLDNTGPGGTSSVYAARDIYAWPHHESAFYRRHVVATHDLKWPPIPRATSSDAIVYRYRICTDSFTFPAFPVPAANPPLTWKAGDPAQWVPYINHAMRQWQYATNGLVQMIHEVDEQGNSLPCSGTSEFLTEIADEYNLRKGQGKTDSEIDTYIASLLKSLKEKGIKGRLLGDALATDLTLSEILMIDDVTGPTKTLANRVFDDVSVHVGIPRCSSACALAEEHVDPKRPLGRLVRTADIYLFRSGVWADRHSFLDLAGVEQIQLNTCPSTDPDNRDDQYHRPYSSLIHESGHALGLAHPTNLGPVMSYDRGVPLCSPHPFDVLALMALYQSRGARSA